MWFLRWSSVYFRPVIAPLVTGVCWVLLLNRLAPNLPPVFFIAFVLCECAGLVYLVRPVLWPAGVWDVCWAKWRAGEVGRAVVRALEQAGAADVALVSLSDSPTGHIAVVRVPHGADGDLVLSRLDSVASSLRIREAVGERSSTDASLVRISLVEHDPLESYDGAPHPDATSETDATQPVPIGVREDGEPAMVAAFGRHVLLGGSTGSGKSSLLHVLLSWLVRDPRVSLVIIDGKGGVELSTYERRADGFAANQSEALPLLRGLLDVMTKRYEWLRSHGVRAWPARRGLIVLGVDEWATLTATGDRDADKEAALLFRRLAAEGRAAGILIIAATQRPSTDLIPAAARDNFGVRLCLRTATKPQAVTVLGELLPGVEPTHLPRGFGYLGDDTGNVVRFRASYLDDAALTERIVAACRLRNGALQLHKVERLDLVNEVVEAKKRFRKNAGTDGS